MDTYVEFSLQEVTRGQFGDEPGPRTLIGDLQQIIPQGDKQLSLLSNGENETDLIQLSVNFHRKYEKNVPIIINDGEHTWRIEDEVSLLQLFSCNHEDDSRIKLHASKSSGNVVIVAKDTNFLMFLIQLFHVWNIKRMGVKVRNKQLCQYRPNMQVFEEHRQQKYITVACDYKL